MNRFACLGGLRNLFRPGVVAAPPPPPPEVFATPKIAVVDYSSDMSDTRKALLAKYPIIVINRARSQLAAAVTFNNGIKTLNPAAKIYQYVILNEEGDPQVSTSDHYPYWQALNAGNFWAKTSAGVKTQWTTTWGNYEVNITNYPPVDGSGKRVPELKSDFVWTYYLSILGTSVDGIFEDNLFWRPRKATGLASNTCADYNLDGTNDLITDATLQAEYRASFVRFWDALKIHRAGLEIIGNTDIGTGNLPSISFAELTNKVEGALLEAVVGKSYSIGTYGGIGQALLHYRSALANVKAGGFVMFNTYVTSSKISVGGEYSIARYGLCMCLFDAGYYTLADDTSSVKPFEIDEFTFQIGTPVDAPPAAATSNGIWKRAYTNGCAVLNPAENGGKYMQGAGFTLTRNGAGTQVTMTGTWVHGLAVGATFRIIRNRSKSSFNGVFTVATVNSTTSITWNQAGTAGETDTAPDGTFGIPKTIDLTAGAYKRGTGTQDPTTNSGAAVGVLTLYSGDAILLLKA